MPTIDNTIRVEADFLTESGTTFDAVAELYEPDDVTPFPLTGYTTSMDIIHPNGKVVKKLTDGNGYTVAINVITWSFEVDLPVCDYTYKFKATNGSTFDKTILFGHFIVS